MLPVRPKLNWEFQNQGKAESRDKSSWGNRGLFGLISPAGDPGAEPRGDSRAYESLISGRLPAVPTEP